MRIGEHSGERGIRRVLIENPVDLALPHRDLLCTTRHEIEQAIAGGADRLGHAVFEEGDVSDRLLLG